METSVTLICLTITLLNSMVRTQMDEVQQVPYWSEIRGLLNKQKEKSIIVQQSTRSNVAPWQVSIMSAYQGHFCSGAIIGPKAVLTSANCVIRNDKNIMVKYGGIDRTNLEYTNVVTKVILPPNFEQDYQNGVHNDVAILRLQDQIYESDLVKYIDISDRTPSARRGAQLIGWETTKRGRNNRQSLLKFFRMTIMSSEQCKGMTLPQNQDKYICTRNEQAGVCQVESGAPLVIDQELVGILSNVGPHCLLGSRVLLTNIASVKEWIISNTRYLSRKRQKRIRGGQDAGPYDAPWMVSYAAYVFGQLSEHLCGAALIAPRAALTAAHCTGIGEGDKYPVVSFGGLDRTNLAFRINVTKKIFPPNFGENRENKTEDDIVILIWQDEVLESDKVKFIEIADQSPAPGKRAQLTGWGYTWPDPNLELPINLQITWMTITSREQCVDTDLMPNDNYICAIDKTSTACAKDSGGPLVVDNKLVGLVSRAFPFCPPNYEVAFVDVAKHRDWILANIKNLSP